MFIRSCVRCKKCLCSFGQSKKLTHWQFLPFYAILRAIPDKLGGVIGMFTAILILFFLPFLGNFKTKSNKFVKLSQIFFWLFISDVILLGWLGSCLVEQPYVIISQLASIFYFSYFILVLPFLSFLEKQIIVTK